MKKKVLLIIIVLFICCISVGYFIYKKNIPQNENISEEKEFFDNKNFYLETGNLYVLKQNTENEYIQIPGNFANVKFKYINMFNATGYVFYIKENGEGEILRTKSYGEEWNKVEFDFALNDNCEFQFLNQFDSPTGGFLLVPNNENTKSDLYVVDDLINMDFVKVDISDINETGKELQYYNMPTYMDSSRIYVEMKVGEYKDDENSEKFITNSTANYKWITEKEFYRQKEENINYQKDSVNSYNKRVDELDETIFVKDFSKYNVPNNDVKISESQAKQTAIKGFIEEAKRYNNKEYLLNDDNEEIRLETVKTNSFFTGKLEGRMENDNYLYEYSSTTDENRNFYGTERKAYVIKRGDTVSGVVEIYVDAATGLIIGGNEYGI